MPKTIMECNSQENLPPWLMVSAELVIRRGSDAADQRFKGSGKCGRRR